MHKLRIAFGVSNLSIGSIPSLFLIIDCVKSPIYMWAMFLFTFFGWVTDNPFVSYFDYFMQTIVERGALIISFLSSLFLLSAGIALLRKKLYGVRLSFVSLFTFIISEALLIISIMSKAILHKKGMDHALGYYKENYLVIAGLILYSIFFVICAPYLKKYLEASAWDDKLLKTIRRILMVVGAIILLPLLFSIMLLIIALMFSSR